MAPQQRNGFASFISWAWAILVGLLAVAGGVGTAASKDFRHVVRDGAEWLYPLWLVVLLAVIAVSLGAALGLALRALARERADAVVMGQAQDEHQRRLTELERRADPGRADHDARVLRTIRETLPRGDIDYWDERDLGDIWHGEKTHHLMQLIFDHNAVEDRFLDPELEPLRVELMSAVDGLMSKCALYGIGHRNVDGAYHLGDAEWVRDNPPEGERYDRYWARRGELNETADELVRTYDALMTAAQERLPAAFAP